VPQRAPAAGTADLSREQQARRRTQPGAWILHTNEPRAKSQELERQEPGTPGTRQQNIRTSREAGFPPGSSDFCCVSS